MSQRYMQATSVKLQQTIDELETIHKRMRTDAERIGVLMKQAAHFDYDRKTIDALNDLHYDEGSAVKTAADKYLQSRMYQDKPTVTSMPGMTKRPGTMPGLN